MGGSGPGETAAGDRVPCPPQPRFPTRIEQDPCRGCGVCCSYFRVSFFFGELDCEPGGTVPADMTVQAGPFLACMKGTEHGNGRCIALTAENRCAIYQKRPSSCRDFPALVNGARNPKCIALRRRFGIAEPG